MKHTLVIRYTERLGDVVRCLPIARHYAQRGERVLFECKAQYHGIFEVVSYTDATECADPRLPCLDLTIWPARYAAFLASGQTWGDFVYSIYPDLAEINRRPVFDLIDAVPDPRDHYGLPDGYCIVSPFGYSQRAQYPLGMVLMAAAQRMEAGKTFILCDGLQKMWIGQNFPRLRTITAETPAHLPRLLRDAAAVLTTNSAPAHISAAVRERFYWLPEGDAQNDLTAPNAERVEI